MMLVNKSFILKIAMTIYDVKDMLTNLNKIKQKIQYYLQPIKTKE